MGFKKKPCTLCLVSLLLLSLTPQTEEHPLHLQHSVGGFHLEGVYRPLPDGQEHLVLCGQPLFQVPLLLPCIQHLNQLSPPRRHRAGGTAAPFAFRYQQDEKKKLVLPFGLLWQQGSLKVGGGGLRSSEALKMVKKKEVY